MVVVMEAVGLVTVEVATEALEAPLVVAAVVLAHPLALQVGVEAAVAWAVAHQVEARTVAEGWAAAATEVAAKEVEAKVVGSTAGRQVEEGVAAAHGPVPRVVTVAAGLMGRGHSVEVFRGEAGSAAAALAGVEMVEVAAAMAAGWV